MNGDGRGRGKGRKGGRKRGRKREPRAAHERMERGCRARQDHATIRAETYKAATVFHLDSDDNKVGGECGRTPINGTKKTQDRHIAPITGTQNRPWNRAQMLRRTLPPYSAPTPAPGDWSLQFWLYTLLEENAISGEGM